MELASTAQPWQPAWKQGSGHREAQQRRRMNAPLKLYLLTDILALVLGFVCACALAAFINHVFLGRDVLSPLRGMDAPRVVGLLLLMAGVLARLEYKNHYRVRMNFWAESKTVLAAMLVAMMFDGFFQFVAKSDFSRLWLMSGWLFSAVLVLLLRALYRRALRRQGRWQVNTLLVGAGITAEHTRAALASESALGYHITAQIDDLPQAFEEVGGSWEALCAANGADYIVVALDGAAFDDAARAIAQLTRESVPFSISPPRLNLPVLDMAPQYFFNHDIKLLTYSSGLEQPLPRLTKRAFDVLVSGGALALLSPLMLGVAWLVRRDGGRAFYGHARIGKDGRVFSCLKFRSMIHDSDAVLARHLAENAQARAEWAADHKLKEDPRITPLGHFLRRTSLDELPQLVNVLRGEMSLVGPRPIVLGEVPKYDHDIAHYYRVRPGITGLWQVSGRNDVTYEQRVQMDSWYVRNWSLWHDIAIVCKTIPALMNRSGAY